MQSISSQQVSVDWKTRTDRVEHTSGEALKLFPQWLLNGIIPYLLKNTENEGLRYLASNTTTSVPRSIRIPSWSLDGAKVVYEKVDFDAIRTTGNKLYSWDSNWEYRFVDVFPQLSRQGDLPITQKQLGNSSIVTMNPDLVTHEMSSTSTPQVKSTAHKSHKA
jgi:hypothetical protein